MTASVAIVGSGNVGSDLLAKLEDSDSVEPCWMVGIDPASEGLRLAKSHGLEVSAEGVEWLLAQRPLPDIICEATSAAVSRQASPRYLEHGIRVVDLTPAGIGPFVVPSVNLLSNLDAPNLSLVTYGGQATIPIVYAISQVVPVTYAETVSSVSSASAGPGARADLDDVTRTTARGLETLGGAERGKAIVILDASEPPTLTRNSVFCSLPDEVDAVAVRDAILEMEAEIQRHVPGYRLRAEPQFDRELRRVAVFLEVEGAGHVLPPYAGNLDVMTAAATRVVEQLAIALTTADA